MPLFTHRHHCALAKALEEVSDVAETAPVINALICALQRDNPRFDAARFRAACAGQPTPKDARSMRPAPAPRRLWWVATAGSDGVRVKFQHTCADWGRVEAAVRALYREEDDLVAEFASGWEDLP
jgi:hypothetical protein